MLCALGLMPFAAHAADQPVVQPPLSQAGLPVVKPGISCSALAKVALDDIGGPGSRIVSTRETTQDGVAVCSVAGILAPTIGFSVTLPTQSWGQRYLQVGCGGLCGHVSLEVGAADSCVPLNAGGFVIASTDMGHSEMGGEFGRVAQKRDDFAYRAVHLTSMASKKLIKAFYGRNEAFSYFSGCSDGGREALVEAQRYPDDFDGILAGAPAMNFQIQNSLHHGWLAVSNTGADGKPILLAAQLPLLHRAVMAQCAKQNAVVGGVIEDPRACQFDPGVLQCKSATSHGDCLTAQQVAAVRRFYDGPRDPATGEHLTVGEPQLGSELAWAGVFVPQNANQPIFSTIIALDALRNVIYPINPPASYSLSDLHFDNASLDRLRALHPLYDATNPDLTAFAAKGHKLILWHGWADEHISPLNTIAYQQAVEKFMGKSQAAAFERLYLLPGVYHCGRGEGPNAVDFLTPVMNWVEHGVAPQAVVTRDPTPKEADSTFGQPSGAPARPAAQTITKVRTRPVYPYPALVRYDGQGDPDQASSYVLAPPMVTGTAPTAASSDFYHPYAAVTH